jgi:hypothetical protein
MALPIRAVLLLNVSLGLSYIALWAMLAWQGLFWRADFTAYYTGWAMALDGRGADLYNFALQASYQQRILAGRSFSEGLLPYLNPPHATLPFVPLALLPLSSAFWVWTFFQLLLLLWLLRLLVQIAHDWQPHERWLMLSAALAFPPLLFTLQLGTFSLLLLACLLSYYLALKRGRAGAASTWLLIATIKPQSIVLPALVLLGARRWRALGIALLGSLGLLALSSLLLGWQSWAGFLSALGSVNALYGSYGVEPATMYNMKGTLALLLGESQSALITQISTLALVFSVVLTLWLWRGPWLPESPLFELRLSLTILLGLLTSLHLHRHDGLMVVAPALLFYLYLRQRGLPQRAFAFWALSCPLVVLAGEFALGGSLGIRLPVVMMLILLFWVGRALIAEQRRAL